MSVTKKYVKNNLIGNKKSVGFKKFQLHKKFPSFLAVYGHNLAYISCRIGKLIIIKQNYVHNKCQLMPFNHYPRVIMFLYGVIFA